MTWWIVVGVVALAVIVLAAVAAVVMGRMRPLARALRRLGLRAEQAEGLQGKVEAMQARAVDLQGRMEEAAARAEHLKQARAGRHGPTNPR